MVTLVGKSVRATGLLASTPINDGNTVAWYKYDVIDGTTGVTKDGSDYVSKWADNYGSGNDIIQDTVGLQPLWHATDGIIFDGADDFMAGSFTWNRPLTGYFVIKNLSWKINGSIFDNNTSGQMLYQMRTSPWNTRFTTTGGSIDGLISVGTDWYIIVIKFTTSSTDNDIYTNRSDIRHITSTTGYNMGGLILGSDGAFASYTNIAIKEIICRDISDTYEDMSRIYGYLLNKHNIIPV